MATSTAPRVRSDAVPLRTFKSQGRPSAIYGVGVYAPDKVISNFDLEKMMDTSDKWITERTGIRTRHIAEPGTRTLDLARDGRPEGARRRRHQRQGPRHDHRRDVHAGRPLPEHRLPAAGRVERARRLRLRPAGGVHQLRLRPRQRRRLHRQRPRRERARHRRRGALPQPRLHPARNRHGGHLRRRRGRRRGAAGEGQRRLQGLVPGRRRTRLRPGDVRQHPARRLRRHGVTPDHQHEGPRCLQVRGRHLHPPGQRGLPDGRRLDGGHRPLGPHQANFRIIDAAARRIGLPLEKVAVNIDEYGNTSSASIPLALEEAIRAGRVKSGDKVLLAGFGAGLTWGATLLEWV